MSVWAGLIDSAKLGQRRLAAGEGLFRQGDTAIAIYAVEQGRVRLVRHLEDGSTVAVHVVRAGETFAEAALYQVHKGELSELGINTSAGRR